MMGRKASFALCFPLSSCCRSAVATCLLVVKLQIFQALRQGQFLLYGHAQQRVQGLLLILCRSQLSLHVVQLGHVLVTPETEREDKGQTLQGNIHSSRGRSLDFNHSSCSTFPPFPRLCFPDGRMSLPGSHNYYIRHFPACFADIQRQTAFRTNTDISIIHAFGSSCSSPTVVLVGTNQ